MPVRNHELTFRPLQGGIEIINPANDRPGTLGGILADGTDRYALSCYHVLCRPGGDPFAEGEPILQSVTQRGGSPVGSIFGANASAQFDCAAARITPGLSSSGRILGLGPLGPPLAASVGMRVLKSGYYTGITEGLVLRVQGDRVEIGRPAGYPTTYELSDFGDSGALWVERDSGSPIAMHTGASPIANALGIALLKVLEVLRLRLVVD